MGGAWSDLDVVLRRLDFSHGSSGGVIATAGFWELRSGGYTMIVSAGFQFIGSGTLLVCNYYCCCPSPIRLISC